MENVRVLVGSAGLEAKAGNYKSAYTKYINSVSDLIPILSTFSTGNNNIEAAFQLAHSSLTKAEAIYINRLRNNDNQLEILPKDSSSLPTNTTSHTINTLRTNSFVPIIPISPLAIKLISIAHKLHHAELSLKSANEDSDTSVRVLRRLDEDVSVWRARADKIVSSIESKSLSPITAFTADAIALQLTIIDLDLFSNLKPRHHLPYHKSSLEVKYMCDFSVFIERVCVNQILSSPPAVLPPSASAAQKANSPFIGRADAISHLISIAYYLLNVYRNISSLSAVLRALESPEIKRIQKSWEFVSPKVITVYKNLLKSCPTAKTLYSEHKELLSELLDVHFKQRSVVVIPWLEPFLVEIDSINESYVVGHQQMGSLVDGFVTVPVLSDIGTKMQEESIETIELCMGIGKLDNVSPAAVARISKRKNKSQGKKNDAASRLELEIEEVIVDLRDVNKSAELDEQMVLGHWILTRVFCERCVLWDNSVEIEKGKSLQTNPYTKEPQLSSASVQTLPIPTEVVADAVSTPKDLKQLEPEGTDEISMESLDDAKSTGNESDGQFFELPTVPGFSEKINDENTEPSDAGEAEFERRLLALATMDEKTAEDEDSRLEDILSKSKELLNNPPFESNVWDVDDQGEGNEGGLLVDEDGRRLFEDLKEEDIKTNEADLNAQQNQAGKIQWQEVDMEQLLLQKLQGLRK
ncbi:DELLA protein rgl3 [Nowakowskiella sp. JEL0407]|nr:DELLA protein rgl3 [Nowakowskiella sp. JEL0407]